MPALAPSPLAYASPLCASLDGLTLHAKTRAGALDLRGREALLCYALRPPIADDGLLRTTLKRSYADGMDPLSLLCRLAIRVPLPRLHTIKYAGVLGMGWGSGLICLHAEMSRDISLDVS